MVELKKNKKKPEYTQKTLKRLKEQGLKAGVVERWLPKARRRKDLFGIIDIVVLTPEGFLGIQSTGPTGFSSHYKEMVENRSTECLNWMLTPNGILELWAWRKVKRFKREYWEPKIHRFQEGDFF